MLNKITITLLGVIPLAVLFSIFYLLATHEKLMVGLLMFIAGILTVFLAYNTGQLIKMWIDDYEWNKRNKKQ